MDARGKGDSRIKDYWELADEFEKMQPGCTILFPPCSNTQPIHLSWADLHLGWGRQVSGCQGDSRLHGWLDRKCRGLSLSSLHWTRAWGPALEGAGVKEWEGFWEHANSEICRSLGRSISTQLQWACSQVQLLVLKEPKSTWTSGQMPLYFWCWKGRQRLGSRERLFSASREWKMERSAGVRSTKEKQGLQPSPPIPQLPLPVIISFFLSLHCISGPRSTQEKRVGRGSWSVMFYTHNHIWPSLQPRWWVCLFQIYAYGSRLKEVRKPAITIKCISPTPCELIYPYVWGWLEGKWDSVASQGREVSWDILNLVVRGRGRGICMYFVRRYFRVCPCLLSPSTKL